MLRLLLLRHAKSDWSANLPDKERQLNPRGRQAAPLIGKFLNDSDLIPDLVLCSPATRVSETWSLVQKALHTRPPARLLDALYEAGSATAVLDVIRENAGDAHTLMVIGHNPWMENLAHLLVRDGDEYSFKRMARKYPTSALAVISLDIEAWPDIAPLTGNLKRFIRPKDLVN